MAAFVSRADAVEVASAGELEADSIVRIASLTKPITAAAVMLLADDGVLGLDDPVERWLPELASPKVVRTPESPLDDIVPAERPITVEDLLSSRAGWGFPEDFTLPAVTELLSRLPVFGPRQSPDAWLATLAEIPLLRQPGEAWLYNTCSDIQGVLVTRASGQPLPDFFTERIFEPLGMVDTGFWIPPEKLDRLPPYHFSPEMPIDDELWKSPPLFPSGSGGLVSTIADWHRFGASLISGGLLSPESMRLLMTDHLTQEQRDASERFLEGRGWGFGGSVGPGDRYGWVGGTGTSGHVVPSTRTIGILFTQVQMKGPAPVALMREFWQYAFGEG